MVTLVAHGTQIQNVCKMCAKRNFPLVDKKEKPSQTVMA